MTLTQPFEAIQEAGLTELIGINEQVDQNDYCGSVAVSLQARCSGEILDVTFYTTEDGTGAVRTPAGTLFVFDANPSISSGDTAMSAAARVTIIGQVTIASTDWVSDANGASAHKQVAIAFHNLSTLYLAFLLTSANAFNDAAGDDEQMEANLWYRRDS
jgi:hypothetical protein